jgi:curli production assembly/transport component CsgF
MIVSNSKEILMKSISCAATFLALLASAASATEIVYTPINPSFGGNPLNGPVLLNGANAVNHYKDPSFGNAFSTFAAPSSLTLFNQQLQSLILSRIASSITGSVFDPNGNLKPGTIETSSFIINIVDLGNNVLKITTTDKSTGASTTFQVTTTP